MDVVEREREREREPNFSISQQGMGGGPETDPRVTQN